jgi:hypothetical protein
MMSVDTLVDAKNPGEELELSEVAKEHNTQEPTRDPLDVVARKILALLDKSDDQRLSAAMLLKESKERVNAGEDPRFASFRAWCWECLPGRSDREIRRLLQIANAPDPQCKLNAMRATTRDQTRRWRHKKRTDSRESASNRKITEFELGGSEPSDAESDRKTFDRILEFLKQKRGLNCAVRISMARRLVAALDFALADMQNSDISAAA